MVVWHSDGVCPSGELPTCLSYSGSLRPTLSLSLSLSLSFLGGFLPWEPGKKISEPSTAVKAGNQDIGGQPGLIPDCQCYVGGANTSVH
jgi:hypothetical protein